MDDEFDAIDKLADIEKLEDGSSENIKRLLEKKGASLFLTISPSDIK